MNFVRTLAAVAALVVGSDFASAGDKGCNSCGQSKLGLFSGLRSHPVPQPSTLFGGGAHHQKLPAFQAAPWYMYWPYDGHFQTPAPIHGAFYGPPLTGNFPVNPYFPHPGGAAGFGPGPMPQIPVPGGR
jgi:hypothetical protein